MSIGELAHRPFPSLSPGSTAFLIQIKWDIMYNARLRMLGLLLLSV